MDGWVGGWVEGCVDVDGVERRMDESMDEWMGGWVDG